MYKGMWFVHYKPQNRVLTFTSERRAKTWCLKHWGSTLWDGDDVFEVDTHRVRPFDNAQPVRVRV